MPEVPRQKKSLDDFTRYADRPQGIHQGLLQDAKHIWSAVLLPVTTLSDPEEIESMSPAAVELLREKLLQPRPTCREYIERNYSPDAVDAMLNHPETNPEKIQQHDALVGEFNALVESGTIETERALDIYERAMKLFNG